MDRRARRPQKQESFLSVLREWVSDNLRYILIAAAALIVALIVIFAVKASNNKKNTAPEAEAAAASAVSAGSEWQKGPTTTITVTPSAASTASASSQAETAASGYPSLDVPGTVITYLDAVADGDVDTASAYSEELDKGTIAVIEAGHPFSAFSNVFVYEYPGTKSGEYVALTTFDYTERATGKTYPGIGAYYLVTGSDGIIRMASDKTTAENQAAIDEVINKPEAQQVIANVNEAYKAVEAQQSGQPAATEGEQGTAEGETGAEPEGGGEDSPAE